MSILFNIHAARLIRLTKDHQTYVSYRLGNDVFWTKKKVTIRAGETLLSDGEHLARTRCGNRLSDVPATPISSADPIDDGAMNYPIALQRPQMATESIPSASIWQDTPASFLLASTNVPYASASGPGGPFIPPFPIPLCCSGPGGPNSPSSLPPPLIPPPATPPIGTPEPAAMVLFVSGFATLFVFAKLFRSRLFE
jgi:hypothetical protein